MSNNRLSHSSVFLYNQCSYCYRLKYIDKIYPRKTKSSFIFGFALDCAFNSLLKERDLEKAKRIFLYRMKNSILNGVRINVPESDLVTYTKRDLDVDLLTHFNKIDLPNQPWQSLCLKGILFVEAYYREVLPKIVRVISIQKPVILINPDGDKITGLLDSEVIWEDGKTYLIDNKSSTVKYEKDSAKKSDQLVLYYYIEKDLIRLDGVGFVVLDKIINMNKKKTCKRCGEVNLGKHQTCVYPNGGTRCNGEFDITFNPTVNVDYIFNTVDPEDEDRVIELFDNANNNIANGIFATEHNPVFSKFGPCDYYKYYEGSPDFYVKEKK